MTLSDSDRPDEMDTTPAAAPDEADPAMDAVADPGSSAKPEGDESAPVGDPAAAADDSAAAKEGDEGDENEDGAPSAAAPDDPVRELEAECDRLRERHLRLAADFDNFRKRTEERVRRRWDSAQADLVGKLLDPLDDLLRVTTLEPGSEANVEAIVEGIDLVERKFMRALQEAGVETVDPDGEPFDPNTMEAMMRLPAESDEMDDTVAQVLQRGYTLRGLLIRPARVSVYKS